VRSPWERNQFRKILGNEQLLEYLLGLRSEYAMRLFRKFAVDDEAPMKVKHMIKTDMKEVLFRMTAGRGGGFMELIDPLIMNTEQWPQVWETILKDVHGHLKDTNVYNAQSIFNLVQDKLVEGTLLHIGQNVARTIGEKEMCEEAARQAATAVQGSSDIP
jgi:hypothetical protein